MPKSASLIAPSAASSTLPGLTSRWTTPARWATSSAASSASAIRRASPGPGRPRRRRSASDSPRTSSITMNAPSGSTSWTVTIAGWRRAPAARASRANRARRSGSRRSGGRVLDRDRAAQRLVVGLDHDPHPALADDPDDPEPGRQGDHGGRGSPRARARLGPGVAGRRRRSRVRRHVVHRPRPLRPLTESGHRVRIPRPVGGRRGSRARAARREAHLPIATSGDVGRCASGACPAPTPRLANLAPRLAVDGGAAASVPPGTHGAPLRPNQEGS